MKTKTEQERLTNLTRGGWFKAAAFRGMLSRRAALICLLSVLAAAILPTYAGQPDFRGDRHFRTFTANAYVGADLGLAVALDPTDPGYVTNLIATVTGIYMQVLASDPPTRMARIAKEIAVARPDVLGLEELYTLQTAPATVAGPGTFTVVYDYLQLLTNALAARGRHYTVAVVSTESDIVMPMLDLSTGGIAYGRIVDHEAILVRSDLPPGHLQVSNPQSGNFENCLQFPMIGLSMLRGWCSVDVATSGENFRYVCTHLEEETSPEIQMLQAQEILSGPANVQMPVVLVGDFNADPLHRTGTTTCDAFINAGFKDAWPAVHRHNLTGGLTWGHDDLLADPSHKFSWRLDLVLYRGAGFVPKDADVLDLRLPGAEPPFWASDHAAVGADFLIERPRFSHGVSGFGETPR